MRIPEGRIVTREVRTEFASPENVVAYFNKKQFTGYLCAQHGAQRDYLLFLRGKVEASLESIGHGFHFIPTAKILERAAAGGDLFIGELAEEICIMAQILLKGKKRHENLNTAFAKVRPFLMTLSNDGLSGVVEVENQNNYGCIMMQDGVPTASFVFVETRYLEGSDAFSSLLAEIDRQPHTINVYEAAAVTEEGKV